MQKKIFYFLAFYLLFAANNVFAQNTVFRTSAYFDFGKSAIKTATLAKLSQQIDSLWAQNNDIVEISLCGNTDAVGSSEANETLSRNRCAAVQGIFSKKGIAASLIKTVGKGELAPIADNETDEGRQQNRRVDIEIKLKTKPFVNVLKTKSQDFATKSGRDTTIVAKNGTVFHFRPDVFDVPNGTPLKIEIREALTYSDMILDRLSTVSNGQLLETGGMVKLDVTTQTGEPVAIKAGKTVQLRIPTDNTNHKMQTFYAEETAPNKTAWKLPRSPQFPTYSDPKNKKKPIRLEEYYAGLTETRNYEEPWVKGEGYCGVCDMDTTAERYDAPKTVPACLPCYLAVAYKDRFFMPINAAQRLHNRIHDSLAIGRNACKSQWKNVKNLSYRANALIQKYGTSDSIVILKQMRKEYRQTYNEKQNKHIQNFLTHYGFTKRKSLDSLLATCSATKKENGWSRSLFAKYSVNTPMALEAAIQKRKDKEYEYAFKKMANYATNRWYHHFMQGLKLSNPKLNSIDSTICLSLNHFGFNIQLQIFDKVEVENLPKYFENASSMAFVYQQASYELDTLIKQYNTEICKQLKIKSLKDITPVLVAAHKKREKKQRDELYAKYNVKNEEELQAVYRQLQMQEEVGYYIAEVTQTGWVNMDRFMGMQNLVALAPVNSEGATVIALFKNYKCCLGVSDDVNPYADSKGAPQVPQNEAIVLVSYKVKGDKAYFGKMTTTTSTATQAPKMEEISLDELKRRIKELS